MSSLLLIGAGCLSSTNEPIQELTDLQTKNVEEDLTDSTSKGQVYVSFIQNVHDWVFPDQSIETLHRVIDLHEQYQIPVDLYFDDQVVHTHLQEDAELLERMRTSEYVSVSWHIRPPHPLYTGFDNLGLDEMTDEEIYDALYEIETHRLDLETGLPTEDPGGYAYFKELMGYAPRVVTHTTGRYGRFISQIYREMGAQFTVEHGDVYTLDMEKYGLHYRPEHVEVKLYEDSYQKGFNIAERFQTWTEGFDGEHDWFINLKYHENNFYTSGTPFAPVYWEDYETGRRRVQPTPYDLSQGETLTEMKSPSMQQEKWEIYEETLSYIANHAEQYQAITSADLEQMLHEQE